MGKKALAATALLAGGILGVSNGFLNYALKRKSTASPTHTDDPQIMAKMDWVETHAKRVTLTNHCQMRLVGWYIPRKGSHKYVVICHGYGCKGKQMAAMASAFYDMGYQVLMPDLRSHGESDGSHVGMGWLDRYDLLQWTYALLRKDPNAQVVYYGVSMGAATVMMAAGEKLPKQVKAIVEDCGYTSVWDQFRHHMHRYFHLPAFPLLYVASSMSKISVGYRFKEASALKQVRKCTRPILFIHGEADTFVPYEMVFSLYQAANCPKSLLTVPNAAHAESYYENPALYWGTIQAFLSKYVNG